MRKISIYNRVKKESLINLVFQPIVKLHDHVPIGYEALSRPSSIFQERDKSKLLAVDLLALGLAVEKARSLFPQEKVFVNIRPATLIWLFKTRQKLFLPDNNFVLELTEQENENPELVKKAVYWVLNRFKCEIAIDDLSSGYNRLRFTNDLFPAYLKIDRPLVRECNQSQRKQQMIKGIIQLAKTVGADLIAEGIETCEEKETLANLGISLGQGYLLGKPINYENKIKEEKVL